MNISINLERIALEEFESYFGELISDFREDEAIYSFLSKEYLKGVHFGLVNNKASMESSEKEAVGRYQQNHKQVAVGRQIENCSKLVFLYGVSWGHSVVNGIEL